MCEIPQIITVEGLLDEPKYCVTLHYYYYYQIQNKSELILSGNLLFPYLFPGSTQPPSNDC